MTTGISEFKTECEGKLVAFAYILISRKFSFLNFYNYHLMEQLPNLCDRKSYQKS